MTPANLTRVAGLALALTSMSASEIPNPKPQTPNPKQSVTFSRDIAPLVFDRCARCHQPGGPAPFSLLTYAAVTQRATQIADVTRRRVMPPWKAEPESGEFVGQKRLTGAEIDMIQRWAESGTPEGNPRDLPPPPRLTEGWVLGQPDVIVDFPDSYTLQAEGTDVFRIFVLPLPIRIARHVRGMEFRPGNPRVVHHANIRLDRTAVSRARDADDPAPGYDGLLARSAGYPDGHFLGWTPGQVVPLLDRELAWRLEPGTDLVIQLHMQPSGKPEAVRPSVGLFFAPEPDRQAGTRTPAILRLGYQGIDIAPGDPAYVIKDSYVLPVDVDVLAVQPHAHYRAREIQGVATLPDGSKKWLIHIKDWDFRWQHVYRFVTPMRLPKGTTVAMQFTYDNSEGNARNPERPPARARWGQRSRDEMGDLWLQVLTRDPRDRATLTAEVLRKMSTEDAVGYETVIGTAPADADLHDDVAVLYLELGKADAAVTHFEASLRLKPDSAPASFNLGTALALAGRLEPARAAFERALQIRPDYSAAHNNLGNVLAVMGKGDEAIRHFREALRLDPNNAQARTSLERETKRQQGLPRQ
jgi:Flp pilus assembly protein TadD/mono/diheme cytochrome c family protein